MRNNNTMNKKWKVRFGNNSPRLLLFLFFMATLSASAQTKTITGTTKDADGIELPGVNIIEKGTFNGVVSDIDGNYSIQLKNDESATLLFSYIGFKTIEVPVGIQSTINVTMESNAEQLEDVVVVGYGSQKKETVVGSITQAKGEELLKAGSVTTISEALTGLLPGVTTMQAAGQPGSTAANILIRGRSSWTDSSPLYMVDGVERDFNNLDPNEIESISVLKDASATAVYGVKAANGVILITTKQGHIGKPKIQFTANVGMKSPTIDTDYAADYATNLEYYNLAQQNDGNYDKLVPQFYIDRWRDPAYADNPYYQYTSFINSLMKTGYTHQYNLNISGGNDRVKYFTSFGYNYDGDIFDLQKQPEFDPRTYQHRFNYRTNLDFNFSKSTLFSVKLSGDMTNWNGNFNTKNTNGGIAGNGGSIMQRMYSTALINAPAVYENGRLGYDYNNSINVNYLGMMEREGSYGKKSNRLFTDFILKQDLSEHVYLSGKLSYNYYRNYLSEISKRWNDAPIYYYVPSSDGYNPNLDGNGNVIQEPITLDDYENPAKLGNEGIDGYNSSIYYELNLNYNQSFGDHNVSALGLFQRRKDKWGSSFPHFEEGWVGRVTYGYKNKYLFESNGAYNGNENFAPGKRFGFFPSLALGWVVSEENFAKKNLSFIDFFKIRYSYGKIGSDKGLGDNRFAYISSYSSNQIRMAYGYVPNITGNQNADGLYIYSEDDPPVLDVSWETATKQNLGFEFNVLRSRLRTTVDLFKEDREGILMQRRTIPNWYGNANPYGNIGRTKNHGIDIELEWNDYYENGFSYWLKGNLSITENRIVERDDPAPTPDYQKEAGKPIGWTKGMLGTGLAQNWDDAYAYTPSALLPSGYIPGDLTYNDYNADGIIDKNDQVSIGDPSYATKSFAFSFGLSYKNWSLTSMFNGMYGISKQLSANFLYAYNTNSSLGFMLKNNEQKDAWTPNNTDTDVPVLHTSETDHYKESSNYTYRNSTFVRLRNVELKYSLPKSFLEKIGGFDNFEFYVNGNNLYTWQYLPRSFDPEANKLEVYPITKRYNVGLRLSF
ncbi:SusC/RagA family TonB-linked outer membrane protein [Zobellia uliginosa]|nr:TonB-dependent receptor [Zobellia uliginosa]